MQDPQVFTDTIKANERVIYKVASIYARDREDLKDLYQEIVYQLWRSFESFQGRSALSTWIYRVALNTSIAYLNRQRKSVVRVSGDTEIPDIIDDQDKELEGQMEVLNQHIGRLNVVEKGLIVLYLEGKTYEEMAEITGFSVTNIGTRLGRIKQKLKKNIRKN